MPRSKRPNPQKSNEAQQNRVAFDYVNTMGASSSNIFALTNDIQEVVTSNEDHEGTNMNDDLESVRSIDDEEPDEVSSTGVGSVLSSTSEDPVTPAVSKKRMPSNCRTGKSKRKKKRTGPLLDPFLQDYLDHCDFYLTVINTFDCRNSSKFPTHLLGSITVKPATILEKSSLENVSIVYLYVSPYPEKCILYLEDSNRTLYWQVQCSVPYSAMESIKSKHMFSLFLVGSRNENNNDFFIDIYIEPSGFHTMRHQSDTTQNLQMLSAIERFLKIPSLPECPSSPIKPKWPHKTTQELYDGVRQLRLQKQGSSDNEHLAIDNLLPVLRPYQQDAVCWMLTREEGADIPDRLHQLYMELNLPSGQVVYFNIYSGIICHERPVEIASSFGGILADEMGLGKTVEVLACILAHPRPANLMADTNIGSSLEVDQTADVHSSKHLFSFSDVNQVESVDVPENGRIVLDSSESQDNLKCETEVGEIIRNNASQSRCVKSINLVNADAVNSVCEDDRTVEVTSFSNLQNVNNSVVEINVRESSEALGTDVKEAASVNNDDQENKDVSDSDMETNSSATEVMSDYDYEPEEDEFMGSKRTIKTRNSRIHASEKDDEIGIELKDQLFECLCGKDQFDTEWVQCTFCESWQHKFCMNFDEEMDESQYLCPHCWVSDKTPLAKSRATLVVTPSSIRCQWEEEIERHLKPGSLKWTFYRGVGQLKQFMQPLNLADHDLVLVTYETLRKELDYADLPHSNSDSGRRFRNPKRFMAIPTPLLAVEWWRICLDEAQMVEGVTTKTAEMALRLSAVNRWCVTGTPIQKSIDDLYGLLLFLGEDPYWQKTWWKRLLYEPYRSGASEPLTNILTKCFWRNTKKDVLHQIGLPPQSEVMHKLIFSPVEEHFYKLQYQECSADALRRFSKFRNLDIKLKELDKQTMAQVMGPLIRLRQACCHPQAVRGHHLPLQKTTITMEELLTSLIKKTKVECEDSHRQFISALNGLAGIHIINEEIAEAIEKYREVLRAVKEQKDILKTDKIQQYHTLHNLSHLLKGQVLPFEETIADDPDSARNKQERVNEADNSSVLTPRLPPNVGRTLEDDTLQEESEKLHSVYLEKCHMKVAAAQTQLSKSLLSVKEIESQFYDIGENWWVAGCKTVMRSQMDEALVFKVKDALSGKELLRNSLSNRFNSVNGLMLMFTKLLDTLKESQTALKQAVYLLPSTPTQDDVNTAITCHLRPLVTVTERCVYCRCHELFNQYEGQLFCFQSGFEKDPLTIEDALWGQTRKGTWADSELECALKAVLAFFRTSRVSPDVVENGNVHMKLFEARKKEFRCLRGVWMQIRDYASALDELEMAKIRFRLRFPDEPKPDIPLPYILEQQEVQPMKLKMMNDRAVAQNDLRKKLGQLFYLQNLQKADFGRKGGSNSEPCPICQKMLGTEWSVLQCGHCFCVECIHILILEHSVGFRHHSVRCAVCRQVTTHAEIKYVNTCPATLEEDLDVKGSHPTKVEAVVRCLLTIKRKEPEAKSLVFSSWQLVLNVLEEALTKNDISCVTLQSHNLQKSLWQFKHNPDIRVLLLPVHSGANGLNLIEATHVLMVEALLNPAAEVQALGRVHRIGQTKPTTVHRFIVSSTIEERIHQACAGHSDDESMTIGELKKLFEVM